MSKALVLFSGGLDSTTCLYFALKKHDSVTALSFNYHQRHIVELKKAKKISEKLKIPHLIVNIQNEIFKNSSLTDRSILVRKNSLSEKGIPNTYVPGRNILFLSYATSVSESYSIQNIYIGVNSLDYSGYPDCRPEFIRSFEKMIRMGTKMGKLKIYTPLQDMTKKDIVLFGKKLGVPFAMTHSCYDPVKGNPCGACDSCILRKKGFEEAGVEDL